MMSTENIMIPKRISKNSKKKKKKHARKIFLRTPLIKVEYFNLSKSIFEISKLSYNFYELMKY